MGDKPPNSIKELLKHFTDIIANLKEELDEVKKSTDAKSNANLKEELAEVKKSMEFMNKTFEELRGTKKELEDLRKDNAALKKEKDELAQSLLSATKEITDLKQYTRKNNLEIKGIPKEENESLVEVVQKIGVKVGVTVAASDIDVVHRVPTKEKEKTNVIVRFVSRARRDDVLRAAKKKRFTANEIGYPETNAVFINEHLCPESKVLLGLAIAKKKRRKTGNSFGSQRRKFLREKQKTPRLSILPQKRTSRKSCKDV